MSDKNKKTVSIWAPLRFVNYGDDMQAIAFALHIKSMGYNVKVFLLEESLAKKYDLQTVSTCMELFKDVNLCIIAGGSHMVPLHPAKQWLSPTYRQYEMDFYEIVSAMKEYPNLKICPLSIGGDGKEHLPLWYYGLGRYRLFHSHQFIDGSVRLEGDVAQMAKMGKKMVYYPDMLFRSADYFEPEYLPKSEKYRVGFNFKKNSLDSKMIDSILRYAEEHDDIEFHFTTTHMDKANLHYQYVPEKESKNIFIDKYTSPNQLLGVLGSMDVFITSMLHVGLTGLTMGTPCLSYRGPGKTKAFLRSIGGDWAIMDDEITFEQLRSEYFTQSRDQLYNQFDVSALERFKTESGKHYDMCTAIVEKYA